MHKVFCLREGNDTAYLSIPTYPECFYIYFLKIPYKIRQLNEIMQGSQTTNWIVRFTIYQSNPR